MKLFLALLIFTQTALAGLPPTTMQSQSGSKQTTFNFQVPNRQATQTGGVNQLIETGNKNLLVNSGFEHQTYSTGWTTSGTATYSGTTTASEVLSGLKSFKAVASAQTIDLLQDTTLLASSRVGSQMFYRFSAKNTAAGVTACVRANGVKLTGGNNCLTLATDGVTRTYELAFLANGTSNGIEIDAASTTGTLIVDEVEISTESSAFIDVAQIGPWIDYGPITITGTTTNPTKATTRQQDNVRCRVVGQDYECEYRYRADSGAGSADGSGGYLFALPSGVSFDPGQPLATVQTYTGIGSLAQAFQADYGAALIGGGRVSQSNTDGTIGTLEVYAVSSNRFQVLTYNLDNSGQGAHINSSFFQISASNVSYSFFIKFRGAGLSNKITTYSQFAVSDVSVENNFVAKVSDSGVVSAENLDWINGNCTPSGGIYTCTFNTGIFTVAPTCQVGQGEVGSGQIAVSLRNSETSTQVDFQFAGAAGRPVRVECTKSPPDYKAKNVITGSFSGIEKCADPYECTDTFSARISGTAVSSENIEWVASSSGTTTKTVVVNAGVFSTLPNCQCTTNEAPTAADISCKMAVSSSTVTSLVFHTATNAGASDQNIIISCQKQGADFRPKTAVAGTFIDSVVSPGAGKPGLCSAKISSTGVISDQIGGCFASCTNATTPVCTFTSNYWVSGSVPNCWHMSTSGNFLGGTSATTTTFAGLTLSGAGTPQAGSRDYFCTGLRQ